MRRRPTRPLRVVRARSRWLHARARHAAEVRGGRALESRDDRVPIFILGAPRSGTTLLYQLLVEAFDVGYLANAHAASPSDVVRVERDQRPRAGRGGSDFESSHGSTPQVWGPSEAGEYWYRFFDRDRHQVDAAGPDDRTVCELRAAVRAFAEASGAPVVFKNTINSLRVPALAAALPEARFVLIERDLADNARSLLVGRVKRGDTGAWWSARPDGADALAEASPAEQVVWQARRVTDVARTQLEQLSDDRWTQVTYGELCAAPGVLVDRIHRWLAQTGVEVQRREAAVLPRSFDRRGGGRLDPELERQLAVAVAAATSDDVRQDGA